MKRDVLAAIWAAMVAFVATSCVSASSEKPEAALPAAISIPVYFLDADGKPLPPKAISGDMTLALGAILGHTGGYVGKPIQTFQVGHDKKIQLDLAGLSARLNLWASQFEESDAIAIEPQETRFARVSLLSKKGRDSHFVHVRADNPQVAVVICPEEALDKVAKTLSRQRPHG